MKRLDVDHCSNELQRLCEAAQSEHILLMRKGKPVAMIVGRMYKDEEDIQLEASPAFWRMIQESRKSSTEISLTDLEKELAAQDSGHKKRKTKARATKRASTVR